MEEKEAIARLKRGNINGLETLVARYCKRAVQSAYLVVGDPEQAEDIAQSAFVNVYERIGSFDGSRPFGS